MGLFDLLNIMQDIANVDEIIEEGLQEALGTMESMVANEGQAAIFESYVAPEFESAATAPPTEGWQSVDIGEYMDFMGEIVEAGNQIMEATYDYAVEVLMQQEEYDEGEIDEETGEFLE